jgi:hypothetical protein
MFNRGVTAWGAASAISSSSARKVVSKYIVRSSTAREQRVALTL